MARNGRSSEENGRAWQARLNRGETVEQIAADEGYSVDYVYRLTSSSRSTADDSNDTRSMPSDVAAACGASSASVASTASSGSNDGFVLPVPAMPPEVVVGFAHLAEESLRRNDEDVEKLSDSDLASCFYDVTEAWMSRVERDLYTDVAHAVAGDRSLPEVSADESASAFFYDDRNETRSKVHPHVVAKLRDEVRALVVRDGRTADSLTSDELLVGQRRYLEQVIDRWFTETLDQFVVSGATAVRQRRTGEASGEPRDAISVISDAALEMLDDEEDDDFDCVSGYVHERAFEWLSEAQEEWLEDLSEFQSLEDAMVEDVEQQMAAQSAGHLLLESLGETNLTDEQRRRAQARALKLRDV